MLPGKTYTPSDILGIVRRRWVFIIVPPMVTLFAALLYSSTVPDLYQSDMLIGIVPQRVPDEFVRSTVTIRTEERLDAITSQIMSRSSLEPLITEMGLYSEERRRLPMEDVILRMRDNIKREFDRSAPDIRNGEPRAFHVQFTYRDPLIAMRVTQRLGSMFVDQNARDRGALAEATDKFLETQLAEARQRLEVQEKRVEGYRKTHGNELPTQMQSNLQAIQNMQLQVQAVVEGLARDRDRKLMLERLYQDAAKEPAEPPIARAVPVTNGPPAPLTAQQQLAAAKASLSTLELRLTPEHPDVVRMKRVISELEPKAAAEREQHAAAGTVAAPRSQEEVDRRDRMRQMQAEIESLDRQTKFKESEEHRLRDQVAEYQRRIEAVPGVESAWTALTRDYETQQAAYRDLLTKSEAAKVSVDLENRRIGENFRVLDPPRIPVKPVSPKRIQITAIGFALGFVLGLSGVALLEVRDTSFRTEADVVGTLGLPILATVPFVETAKETKHRRRLLMAFSACAGVLAVAGGYVFWAMRLWTVLV